MAARPSRAAAPTAANVDGASPKRAAGAPTPAATPPSGGDRKGRPSAEERNAAVRASLHPLAPGERPWAIKIATLIALLVGGGDLIDVIVGGRIRFGNTHAGVGGVLLFSVMMLICAVGMWQLRYWAVLGFQAILAIVVLIFALLLIRASNLLGLAVALVIVGGGGFLFYKLVRVLSRIQMPKYPGR
jgi:hypothetical protein